MLFREKEIRLVVRDSSGLSNSIIINKSLFEECHLTRSNSNDGSHLVKLDFKDFNSIQKVFSF